MSTHISAKAGAIAERILLPGDPLRAQWIADNFLTDPVQFNDVRNMLGFTGTYEGVPVSVMGTGMGIPSISIYVHELFAEYGVKTAIRVGTAGALREDVHVRDVVIVQGASTDSGTNRRRFGAVDYAALSDFGLLETAYRKASERDIPVKVGGVYSADLFYGDFDATVDLGKWGVLAVEMEASALFTLAAQFGVRALAICTISDHLLTKEETSAKERQETFSEMIEVALDTAIA